MKHATTWMKLEGIVLSEIGQARNHIKPGTSPLLGGSKGSDAEGQEAGGGRQGLGEGGAHSYCLAGTEFQFCQMKKALEKQRGEGCTAL